MAEANNGIILGLRHHHSGRSPCGPIPKVPAGAGKSFPVTNLLRRCIRFLGRRQHRFNLPKSFSRHLVGVFRDRPVWQLVDRVRVFNECSAHEGATYTPLWGSFIPILARR